ncbi:MAG: pyruvate kinase [Armatimonadota bacterium]
MKRTKIVATLGPASERAEVIRDMALAGLDVVRLNFSHGVHPWHAERFRAVRSVEEQIGRPLSILQDLSGPKLRIGELPPEGMELFPDHTVSFSPERYSPEAPTRIPLPIPELVAALQPSHQVFLDDGQIEMQVTERRGDEVFCVVRQGGLLRSRKGIAAPAVPFEIPALTEKDFRDLDFGLQLGVDWVAVSFVRRAEDLEPVRAAIERAGAPARIIAKVEKPEAVEAFDEIVHAADGIMVARGDLGVEMPLFQVPMIQKELIRRTYQCGKPVITATQMLESMTKSPRPTRAEVSDVANAIVDGTSAVMLSGETAMGDYPVQAVSTMASIARYTESQLDYRAWMHQAVLSKATSITDAISQGVAEIAEDLEVSAILCSTTSGYTARMLSRLRPRMPIVAATSELETYRRLPLIWGVRPLLVPRTTSTDERLAATVQGALKAGWVQSGDTVVLALGAPVGTPGHTNLIKVQKV